MLFPTSLLELTRRERTVTALFGRVHVNRFLKGNYFSGLNVINLNSPLVKLLPIINMEQVAMLISEGIPIQLQVFPRRLKPLEELLRESTLHPRVGTVHPDGTLRSRAPRFHHENVFSCCRHGVLQHQNCEQEQDAARRGWGRDRTRPSPAM